MVMHIANRSSLGFMAMIAIAMFLGGCGNRQSAQPGDERRSVPAPDSPRSKFIPTQADIAGFLEEGKEPTLRRIAAVDYFLQYQMLRATGTEQALGGEENAMAALLALGNAYERRVRVLETELPTMLRRVAFTGEGMSSGFTGMGLGWLTGMLTGGMTSGMVSTMTDAQLEEWRSKGPLKYDGKDAKAEINVGKDGSISQSMELEVNVGGINGKVKMKLRMAACPDVNGRVEVEIDVDSQMSVIDKPGSGGYVQSTFKYERYLDDDAHLIESAGGSASSNHIRMGGFENFERQYVDITVGHDRSGNPTWDHHDDGGFNIFRMDEVERVRKLLESVDVMQTLTAEVMLRGLVWGPPWESGRCVELKVSSSPDKRTGLKPNTAFDIDARPRSKIDGNQVGGSVTATLAGGSSLTPASGKVPADAKYSYAAPDKEEQGASIQFEARSKRGVGKAQLAFDTKKTTQAYGIAGGADEFHGTGVACDLGAQFSVQGSGVTVSFHPDSPQGGRYNYSGNMSGLAVWGHGTYTVNYQDDVAVSLVAQGPGNVKTPYGTMSRNGSETYTLTPREKGPCIDPAD